MMVTGPAEDIEIVGDEDGWHIVIETNVGSFQFRIQPIAEEFYREVNDKIGGWLREGEAARATMPPRITEEDLDGYPLGHYKRSALEQEMERQR